MEGGGGGRRRIRPSRFSKGSQMGGSKRQGQEEGRAGGGKGERKGERKGGGKPEKGKEKGKRRQAWYLVSLKVAESVSYRASSGASSSFSPPASFGEVGWVVWATASASKVWQRWLVANWI